MRVVLADDETLLREGLVRLLAEAEIEVVGKAGSAPEALRSVALTRPDVAIFDIRMPPGNADDGLVAAQQVRREHPDVGVLVLSHHLEARYALRLLEDAPERVGYLLKERISDLAVLTDAVRRVAEGECVIDPTIVGRLMARQRDRGPLTQLTEREREVLALMAEGHSNQGICDKLVLSPKTVEAHISQIFSKLGLRDAPGYHRRVLAVLALLRTT